MLVKAQAASNYFKTKVNASVRGTKNTFSGWSRLQTEQRKTHLNNGMRGAKELHKPGDNTAADNLIDRGVALLGKKLAKTSGRTKLVLDVVRHDALNHGWKLLMKLH
jgi:hypothetical protein